MPRRTLVLLAILLAGCASATAVRFPNATPGAPRPIPATEFRPAGDGPFPAVVLFHGCHGVSDSTRAWGAWFRARQYVALVVDSWRARGFQANCAPTAPDPPNTERFDDAVGALSYLHARPYVDRQRIGAVGWSNGGVYAMSVVNGPSLERARRRGVVMPEPGYRASVAFYPGGCSSLVHEQVVRPLLVLIGDADDWILPGPCREMVTNMRTSGADASIVLYRGAYHYFDVAGQAKTFLADVENRNLPGGCCGATVAYDRAAAEDAQRRVEEFFGYHLKRS
ncbi:MAG: dienelactone hydrolase family protein [Candidatus Rokubacteria bacterium]|nr:dienelactone hydrolase family protein [Candidatus Rokubacteria bacterium]